MDLCHIIRKYVFSCICNSFFNIFLEVYYWKVNQHINISWYGQYMVRNPLSRKWRKSGKARSTPHYQAPNHTKSGHFSRISSTFTNGSLSFPTPTASTALTVSPDASDYASDPPSHRRIALMIRRSTVEIRWSAGPRRD